MKNVVKCQKEFFAYFDALETRGDPSHLIHVVFERPLTQSFSNKEMDVSGLDRYLETILNVHMSPLATDVKPSALFTSNWNFGLTLEEIVPNNQSYYHSIKTNSYESRTAI